MIKILLGEDGKSFAVEMSADADMDRFYTTSNFAVGGGHIDMLLGELERLELIPPRPKTVEHRAQGLLDIEWHHSLQTEDGGCGS